MVQDPVPNPVQLTLEQHGLELRGSTYTQIFFLIVKTTVLHNLCLVECTDVELQRWRNHVYRGLTISYMQIFNCEEGHHTSLPCCSRFNCILQSSQKEPHCPSCLHFSLLLTSNLQKINPSLGIKLKTGNLNIPSYL